MTTVAGRDRDLVSLERLETGAAFLELVPDGRLVDFAAGAVRRVFGLAGFTFFACVALCARAFPAGERLVAGFNRVDLAFAAGLTDRRADDREESFLTLLAIGVLMRNLPRYSHSSLIKPPKNKREILTHVSP